MDNTGRLGMVNHSNTIVVMVKDRLLDKKGGFPWFDTSFGRLNLGTPHRFAFLDSRNFV
jgi:hypothetical protein